MNRNEAEHMARQHLSAPIRLEPCARPNPSYAVRSSNNEGYYCFRVVKGNIGASGYIAVHKETIEVENSGLLGE